MGSVDDMKGWTGHYKQRGSGNTTSKVQKRENKWSVKRVSPCEVKRGEHLTENKEQCKKSKKKNPTEGPESGGPRLGRQRRPLEKYANLRTSRQADWELGCLLKSQAPRKLTKKVKSQKKTGGSC